MPPPQKPKPSGERTTGTSAVAATQRQHDVFRFVGFADLGQTPYAQGWKSKARALPWTRWGRRAQHASA
jgi:hypothetical protein